MQKKLPERTHILICRTDNIGDVILTLPIVTYLKRHHPTLIISFLCRGYAAPVVRACRSVDHVIELEELTNPVACFDLAEIDIVIFAKPNRLLAKAAKKAGIPNRIGTSHKWFHWLYCNHLARFSRVKSELHEAQLNFALLRPLGMTFVPERDQIAALYQLNAPPLNEEWNKELAQHRYNIVLHPKSNGNGREWPIAHYTDLARQLRQRHDIQLWISGSAAEGAWIAQHAPELLQMPNVRNLCGALSLDVLMAFINAVDGLVASGTGPLHLSAALGKPTLGLFPPIRPIHPQRWGPLGMRAQTLCEIESCSRCSNPKACMCMQNISSQRVADELLKWCN